MTVREQLDQELAQASDSLLEQVLHFLLLSKQDQTDTTLSEKDRPRSGQSVLERMGGMPQHLLSNGNLSDRDQRRAAIAARVKERHQHRQ